MSRPFRLGGLREGLVCHLLRYCMVGFETIGSATIIAYDDVPIVATDPWINGDAYFGSWGLSHQIPSEQMAAIKACKFYWMSHGHPTT